MKSEEIAMNAEVESLEGSFGRTVCVVLDPVQEKVTHLVVQEANYPFKQRLVPIQYVRNTSDRQIDLECTAAQIQKMQVFVETEFLPSNPQMARVVFWPYVIPETAFTIEHQRLPDGEIAVRRGTSVRASDGPIGRVDELMIEPEDGRITHLVLREGHLRGQKDIAIPVSQIEKLDQDTVYLRLSKQEVKALPEIQIRRSKNSRS